MPAALRHIAIPALSRQGPPAGGWPARIMGARQNSVDWASLIVAIATRQDREAFEKVFLHFAPRVKAMLIKLGTTA